MMRNKSKKSLSIHSKKIPFQRFIFLPTYLNMLTRIFMLLSLKLCQSCLNGTKTTKFVEQATKVVQLIPVIQSNSAGVPNINWHLQLQTQRKHFYARFKKTVVQHFSYWWLKRNKEFISFHLHLIYIWLFFLWSNLIFIWFLLICSWITFVL